MVELVFHLFIIIIHDQMVSDDLIGCIDDDAVKLLIKHTPIIILGKM